MVRPTLTRWRRVWIAWSLALAAVLAMPVTASAETPEERERQARALFDEGRYAEAAQAFEEILAAAPDNRTAAVLLGFALARQGRTEPAIAQARRTLDRFPDSRSVELLLAGLLAQREATQAEALARYQAVLARDPDDALARLGMAEIARVQGRVFDAIHDFLWLVERHPDDPRHHVRLGQLYGSLGDLDRTEHHFRRAYDIAPANVDAVRSLAVLGDIDDRPEEALRFYRELQDLYPTDVSVMLAVGASEERLGEPRLPMSAQTMQRLPLEPYMDAVRRDSPQLRHRREQLEATRARSTARFLPSFFVSPSWGTVNRRPQPSITDDTHTVGFSFGWNLADLVANPFRINITGMEADLEAVQAALMTEVSSVYYQRQQNLIQYRQLQRALALDPTNVQLRQNKDNAKYTILHLTERLRILTGMP